ncbi:hypothetical protein [Streptomyces sp. NPDC053560]|uniref:hypothetical protein n=1 Tax=Streptomyces sp. NPDC053560 TaxID=3365711 RepID=UPI0037D58D75
MATLLLGPIWEGLDGEADHVDPGFFSGDPAVSYGILLARSPARSPKSVRELAATSQRIHPGQGGLREAFGKHAADPQEWVGDFDAFTDLLKNWHRVLSEAARRGWRAVGLRE